MPDLNKPEDLPVGVFERPFREGLIHQAVVSYEANQRADLADVKDRSDVRGANKKPWRQKGTGRARHGSRISPLWVGGGQAQAPDGVQDHSKDMPKSMKRGALRSALSVRNREDNLLVLTSVELDEPSTAVMDGFFEDENLTNQNILLLHTPAQKIIQRSTRNLPYCDPFDATSLNTYEVVAHEIIVFTEQGLETFLERVEE